MNRRKGPAWLTAAIAAFIFFILFLTLTGPLNMMFAQMTTLSNETLGGTKYVNQTNYVIGGLGNIFGVCCVIAMISVPIAYFLEAHREEHEEFQEYERYEHY